MFKNYVTFIAVCSLCALSLISIIVSTSSNSLNAQSSRYMTIRDTTESDETDFKELMVACPEGMTAISGGAGIFYDSSEGVDILPVLISSFMYPEDEQSWFAEAVQPKVASTEWRLEVHVTCVDD